MTPTDARPPQDDPLTDDPLTDRVQLLQRRRGHRYSLDDVITAREGLRAVPTPRRYLDLGCGIGSVLLMVWDRAEPHPVECAAIEAQAISAGLARRNIERAGAHVRFVEGDLRDEAARERLGGPFELITGTPPYAPPGTATPSPDSQRAYARIEYRGGIEAYAAAAAARLAPDGRFVVCASCAEDRAHAAAGAAGLAIVRTLRVVPRAGRDVLFFVWTMARGANQRARAEFIARDEGGERTADYVALRRFFGLPKAAP
ncbi:MAG: methyltransferase [Myxococcota bacterium]